MSRARCCRRPVKYVLLPTGKRMPVDPVPDEDGNVAARLVGRQLTGHVLRRGEDVPDGWQRFMPHQALCEIASHLRKGKRAPASLLGSIDTNEGTTQP
ncbi:hypothetical protein GCM10008944_01370 [Cytobacillus oceanisediminis]